MSIGGRPAASPIHPIRRELLHESGRTRVTRLTIRDGNQNRQLIRKELLGGDAETRLQHERVILDRLTGVPGVAQLTPEQPYPDSLLLINAGSHPLADATLPLPPGELAKLALALARAVAAMHRHGVQHRDINPANIVLADHPDDDSDSLLTLVDFALANAAQVHAETPQLSEIVGTLPYLAPEQTGRGSRAGRVVDQRADLYAVGATLYELATGTPPFGTSGDPLQLSHDHLARVPAAPHEVNPAVPQVLSRIIMHLLEKEPDNRYQGADGLVYDLAKTTDGQPAEPEAMWVGTHDYPSRLLPPTRLVGREAETASLAAAFQRALSDRCPGFLVSGSPGVGKTFLMDSLRPAVAARDGWFLTGKFDQYRRDQEADAVWQAFHQLGQLLLAEPEETLAPLRAQLRGALGVNAGLLAALQPEFGTLLHVPPDTVVDDPLATQARLQRLAVEVLRVVAAQRPVVMFLDDLQWAFGTPLAFVDTVISEGGVPGALVVGAYRDDEPDESNALAPLLRRWRKLKPAPEQLRLANLPVGHLTELLTEVLRLGGQEASALARLLHPYTHGNPYETVELLNSLRREGLLVPGVDGWQWDPPGVRHRLEQSAVADLVADRADAMPADTVSLLQTMACLGGRAELGVLRVAAGVNQRTVEQQLAPALEDGLLVMEEGRPEAVRFRHDRVQEDILRRLRPRRQRSLRLKLARRLAARPGLFAVAAEQYLPVTDTVRSRDERRQVVTLLRRAAEQAQLLSNFGVVEKCLTAATRLVEPSDRNAQIELQTGRHAALYSLGRLTEADEAFATVEKLGREPLDWVNATLVQVSSLANRNRQQEAIKLGLALLREFGYGPPPPEQFAQQLDQGLDAVYEWVDQEEQDKDLSRPEITDPKLRAAGALINRLLPPAYFSDHTTLAWLALEAWRIWSQHGPSATLVGPVSHLPYVIVPRRGDHATAYRVARRVLETSDARGYEPSTSQARFLYALFAWCAEPLEECQEQGRLAREGLVRGGDLQNACYTYYVTACGMLDSAPTLASFGIELEAALAFARRTSNAGAGDGLQLYERLLSRLRSEGTEATAEDAGLPTPGTLSGLSLIHWHFTRALAGALLGDAAELEQHTAALMGMIDMLTGTYITAIARVLRALALAEAVRSSPVADRAALLAELDEVTAWVAPLAEQAPENLRHLLRLIEAERAWAIGEFRTAAYAFDVATRDVAIRQRAWHRALIMERAARFHLSHGLENAGLQLLSMAREAYHGWGASAKVEQLDWAYPTLRHPAGAGSRPAGRAAGSETVDSAPAQRDRIPAGAIDMLGILAGSQALSSETSIDGLRARVVDVLSAMTGATGVQLLLWGEEQEGWLVAAPLPGGGTTIPLAEAGRQGLVPVSAVRYAERTGEPLVVADATRDDRFARDPYFAGQDACSLLVVPIRSRGEPEAMLVLENRLIRGAFSAERLDGVLLIAGQLAVSLRNAMVYSSLERKVAERTEALELANTRLERLSVTDALTGLANRRRLEEVLAGEWDRARRAEVPVALAMVDIDHFKAYNDHFGHTAGDRCLQRVAALLRRHLRGADLVARYGGEEFAVVMPGTDLEPALYAAERLRTAMEALAEPHPLVAGQRVTISIGVAAMVPPRHGRVSVLTEQADIELYRAKRAGRNQVRPEPPAAPPERADSTVATEPAAGQP